MRRACGPWPSGPVPIKQIGMISALCRGLLRSRASKNAASRLDLPFFMRQSCYFAGGG
jgi:hypothetical protein